MVQVLDKYGNIKTALTTISGGETDPVYSASSWFLTTNNSGDWDTAYSWGNHASAGYLTSLAGAVLTTRNITINGTMQDLSADRTWTVGSVTSVSIVSANGFAGTVATATTTPAITISTSITGLLKGNGTAISAAVSNTDYLPVASPIFTGTLSSGAGAISIGGNLTANVGLFSSGVRAGASSDIFWNGRSVLTSPSDGTVNLFNAAKTGFTALNFGGVTSSFPALRVNGTTLENKLADNSGFAAIQSLYHRFGSGSPEGVISAPVGCLYSRTDGGAGTSFYVKESGTGNTGWVAK